MKRLIFILALLLIIPLASAQISEGQIITQQQLNNINVSNINYQDLRCNVVDGYEISDDEKYIYKLFDCLEVNQINNNTYLIQRSYFSTITEVSRIVNCLNTYSQAQCRTAFERNVRQQAIHRIDLIKRQIVVYQTPEDPNTSRLREWLRNLNLFGGG